MSDMSDMSDWSDWSDWSDRSDFNGNYFLENFWEDLDIGVFRGVIKY